MSEEIDLRGFEYPLVPLAQRTQWRLDAMQLSAAQALARLQALRLRLQDVECTRQQHHQHLMRNPQLSLNAALHLRALEHLLQMGRTISTLQEQVNAVVAEHKQAVAQCLALQQQIDMFSAHRHRLLNEYIVVQRARGAADQDQAWLARSHWLALHEASS